MSYAQKETLINRYYSSIVNKIKMKIHKKSLINLILIIILIGSFAYADGPYGIPLDDDLKPQPMADLAIIDIIIEPTNPQINDVVTATAKITNLGNIADSYGSMILVKFPDIGMTTGVVAPPDTNNPLEPGEIEYISMDFNATEFGIYEIEASIDPLLEDINY